MFFLIDGRFQCQKKSRKIFFFSDVGGARVFFLKDVFFSLVIFFFVWKAPHPFFKKSVASLNKIGRYFVPSEITVWHPTWICVVFFFRSNGRFQPLAIRSGWRVET